MIVFLQKLSTRHTYRRLNISRQARLDALLQCNPPELAGALHDSKKIEEGNTSRKFLRKYTQIQDEIFLTIRLFEM